MKKKRIKNSKRTFCFDLDNTLCKTEKNNYSKSKPIKKAIKVVNFLFNEGHIIKIYTARYMGRSNDNLRNKNKIYYKISNQLSKWGLKYHKLFISKPSADVYIDDKSYGYNRAWINNFKKLAK